MKQHIGRIIATDAIFVGIDLEHILGPVWIVLQRRQHFDQPPAALVNEQTRPDVGFDVAEGCVEFSPTIHTICVGTAQRKGCRNGVLGIAN